MIDQPQQQEPSAFAEGVGAVLGILWSIVLFLVGASLALYIFGKIVYKFLSW